MNCILRFMVIAILAGAFSVQAQVAPVPGSEIVRIRDLKAEALRSPVYDVRASGLNTSEPKMDWLSVHSEFDVAPEWLDEITFTYYVLLKARRREDVAPATTPYNVFKGTVTYVNVPKGRGLNSAMYLDPWSFKRFGEVEKAAVQVSYRGSVIYEESEPKERERWWEKAPANLLPLLTKSETPYREVNTDLHPTIKHSPRTN